MTIVIIRLIIVSKSYRIKRISLYSTSYKHCCVPANLSFLYTKGQSYKNRFGLKKRLSYISLKFVGGALPLFQLYQLGMHRQQI